MTSNYKLVQYNRLTRASSLESLLENIRWRFIHHDFHGAAKLIEELNQPTPPEIHQAIYLNKALLNQLVGNQTEAEYYYRKTDDTPIKIINYLAFCHRYFLYENARRLSEVPENHSLFSMYLHNRLNYLTSTRGFDKNNLGEFCRNIYGEQLLNESRAKFGEPQKNFFLNELSEEIRGLAKNMPLHKIPTEERRVGIYVSDIQRHQNSSLIFELIEVLLAADFMPFIYFDNIFDNKMVRLLPSELNLRHVVRLGLIEFHNLIARDRISSMINITGNRLRNKSLALFLIQSSVIDFESLLEKTPLPLTYERYFEKFSSATERNGILIAGDLKYLSNEELFLLKEHFSSERRLVFMSMGFNEPECLNFFNTRLKEIGFNSNIEILPTIRPFKDYLSFISGFKLVVLTGGASLTEICEVESTNTQAFVFSPNGVFVDIKKFLTDKISLKQNFSNELVKLLRSKSMKFNCTCESDFDFCLMYDAGDTSYDVDFSCNGDVIIFSRMNGS